MLKLVLLKLQVSLLPIPYIALVRATSLNQALIVLGSSYRALCKLYGRLNCVISLSVRLTKFLGHCLPTWPAPRSESSLSAISCIASKEGANPYKSRSSICLTITSSSSLVSFFNFSQQSRRAVIPVCCVWSINQGTLNIDAARRMLFIWPLLKAWIASNISTSLQVKQE